MAKCPAGEPIKRRKRVLGTLFTAPDGNQAYLHYRNAGDIWREKEPSISDAIRKGTASWAIDEELLVRMRAKGVKFAGIFCRDTGEIWLTRLEEFFDASFSRLRQAPNYVTYRHLRLQRFIRRAGVVKL
jgi:hypothetical protein